ncbi:CHAT domain-containing protein [Tolypothrix campylonemoides VB511288]|nr:CHAT domain-containing protein [Tolypothrix campylonemoides VB511288]
METFELYLSPIDTKRFKAIVTKSPVGEGETETLLPFLEDETDWRTTLIKTLETTAAFKPENFPQASEQNWMVKSGILCEDQSNFHPNYLTNVGQALYRALFPSGSKLEKALLAAERVTESKNTQLHIQLKFEADVVQRSRLADYPWELLHDGEKFLLHRHVTISRYIAHETVSPKLAAVEKVNVLLLSSAAFDLEQGLKPLTKKEQQAIHKGLGKASEAGLICLAELEYATVNELRAYLTEHQGEKAPHVLHFDGHGLFGKRCPNPQCSTIHKGIKTERCRKCNTELLDPQGYLVFENEEGEPDYVSAAELGNLLQQSNFGDGSNTSSGVALVVLSACQSAMAVAGDSVFNGTAQNLISQRVPAVVAMQYSVGVEAATKFAEQFYRSLGQKNSLAVAINQGREAMGIEGNQWYRPVLYLRWRDNEGGQLFAIPKPATPSPKRALIFISAEFNEFKQEIQVLEETLDKLAELYGSIEYFSSHHSQSLQERREKIQESALYIGLFGDNCGLLDRQSQKPFMELEYEVVKTKNIPCLLYFKQSQLSNKQTFEETAELNYEAFKKFKKRVIEKEFVNFLDNLNQLEQEFINDFIKLLRGTLFNKVDRNQQNPFSLDTLHLLCRASIREQIKAVGRDKYIADIYIERGVEKEIESFVKFEESFLEQADKIIDDLTQISQNYRLRNEAYYYLPKAKAVIRNSQTLEQYSQLINELKKAFYYDEVETIVDLMHLTIRLSRELEAQFRDNLRKIVSYLKNLPFVSEQDLSEFPEALFEVRRQVLIGDNSSESITMLNILPSKFYIPKNKRKLANDLIKDLNKLVQLQVQRCIALVSNAGYGKTNVICHLANSLSKNYPVILLSGQIEITSQYDIEYQIQRQLESFLPGSFVNWMNRIKQILDNPSRQCLFILIDGINENSNLPLFIRLLRDFLIKIEDKRIKLILSCRNLFWDLFSGTLKSSLFENKKIELSEFTGQETNLAIHLYFKRFNIQSGFDASNLLSLRNPLLLRFFCEAYRDCQLDKVSNLELLSVFNLYVERIEAKISEQLGFLRTEQIIVLLTKLGYRMWLNRKTSLNLSELEITPEEASKSISIYNLIRSENLIFEESLQLSATQRVVRFLYDEFMEYIIARSWLEHLAVSQELEKAIEILLQEAVSALSSFSPTFGAIIFLDKMLKRNGELVNRIISLLATLEDEFVASRQIVMLEAFEKIDINNVSDELIIALDKFERIARDDIKDKLAPIIIQVLRQHPNHSIIREMISRMLEVGVIPIGKMIATDGALKSFSGKSFTIQNLKSKIQNGIRSIEKILFNHQQQELREILETPDSNQKASDKKSQNSYEDIDDIICRLQLRLSNPSRTEDPAQTRQYLMKLGIEISIEDVDNKEVIAKKIHDFKLKLGQFIYLQPGHYHYDEETKLNAISLLVSSKNTQDYALIEEAVHNLGRIELNSALTALNSLDLVEDELLYKMVDKYYNAYLSEYRIYCAWLLRNRYGKQPAEYLTGLLMDKETRVHYYTFSLFENRKIEKELVISLLTVIQQIATIKPWHLINIIKILGKRNQFYPQELVSSYGKLIVSNLMNLCSHSRASLRLEAYKSLMQYDEFIERQFIISAMEEDKDIYIRRLAESIKLEN